MRWPTALLPHTATNMTCLMSTQPKRAQTLSPAMLNSQQAHHRRDIGRMDQNTTSKGRASDGQRLRPEAKFKRLAEAIACPSAYA